MQQIWNRARFLGCLINSGILLGGRSLFSRSPFRNQFTRSSRANFASQRPLPHDLGEAGKDVPQTDTIYALSTAHGRAAIAVIRISGSACLSIYANLCPGREPPKARTATLRKLCHPHDRNQVLDTAALILFFPSPNSVTGEDILELHVHGGPAIIRSILEAIPLCTSKKDSVTIRHAEPGEYTRRAFYNNRIDLTQAEALGESLAAETEQQRRLAVKSASNTLANRYEGWRRMLLYARGELEALIDFSEDQHFDESPSEFMHSVSKQIIDLRRQIVLHIQNATRGELLRSGIRVALLGAPNAGKSSLLNRIVGREAAIVSAEAGTTRDIVDVSVDIGGWLVRLGDMAGLRSNLPAQMSGPSNFRVGDIESEGIRRARQRALESDLVIVLISLEQSSTGSVELAVNEELLSTVQECQSAGKTVLYAINKTDLLHSQPALHVKSLSRFLSQLMEIFPQISPNDVFCLSCRDAEIANLNESDPGGLQTFLYGLSKQFAAMTTALTGEDNSTTAEAQNYWAASVSVTHRQSEYLKECLQHLDNFLTPTSELEAEAAQPQQQTHPTYHVDGHEDLVGERASANVFIPQNKKEDPEIDIVKAAEHLRYAADCLARITGKADGGDVEDVLGVVFENDFAASSV